MTVPTIGTLPAPASPKFAASRLKNLSAAAPSFQLAVVFTSQALPASPPAHVRIVDPAAVSSTGFGTLVVSTVSVCREFGRGAGVLKLAALPISVPAVKSV